jgi:Raf kinase inhibitor-like YbhB/YbcL family protein
MKGCARLKPRRDVVALFALLLIAPLVQAQGGGQPGRQRAAPPPPAPPPGGHPPPGGRGGRGGGRGNVQVMTLTTTAWADGGQIPAKYTQAGDQVSPPLSWTNVPEGIASFVLIVHDLDAATPPGTDDTLHWMLWNIPAATRSLPEAVAQGSQLPDDTRQISVSGPYYRGPGAPAAGPPHHYVFELFALDAPIDVPAVGASPQATRSAIVSAMATHVRGKAVYTGLFKRAP